MLLKLRSLLDAHAPASGVEGPPVRLQVGRLQAASFDPAVGEVCGCCGRSLEHARTLQRVATAMPAPCNASRVGPPFQFGTGPFFAVSRAVLSWLVASPVAARASASARIGSVAAYSEDIFFGWVLSHCPRLVTAHLGSGAACTTWTTLACGRAAPAGTT